MALATHVSSGYKGVTRYSDASAAATPVSVTVPAGKARRLSWVLVVYSGAPTHSGVTIAVDSGAGAAYDGTLVTSAANLQVYSYVPSPSFSFCDDDQIVVTAPSGGGVLTSTVQVVTEDA